MGTLSHQSVHSSVLPGHVVKDSPQPQDPLELGLLKVNSDLQAMNKLETRQTSRLMY